MVAQAKPIEIIKNTTKNLQTSSTILDKIYQLLSKYLHTKSEILPIDQIIYGKASLKFDKLGVNQAPLKTFQDILNDNVWQENLSWRGLVLNNRYGFLAKKIYVRKMVLEEHEMTLEKQCYEYNNLFDLSEDPLKPKTKKFSKA